MTRKDSKNKKLYTALAFFAIVVVMTIWNLIVGIRNGHLDTMLIFNLDFFGERTGDEQAFTTIFTTVIIVICLVFFIVLVLRQRKDESVKLTHEQEVLMVDMEDVDAMTQAEFDEYLVTLFAKMGYEAEAVEGESGVDVVLHRGADDDVAILAPITREKIGNDAVKACCAARDTRGASEGWIITNSKFESKTVKYAQSNKLRLVDRRILTGILDRACRQYESNEVIMRV